MGRFEVTVLGLEEIIVDRLAAWQLWGSEIDALNAYLLSQTVDTPIDRERLAAIARRREVSPALEKLWRFAGELGGREPTEQELEDWARERP